MSAPIANPIPITFGSRQCLFSGTGSGTETPFYPGATDVQTTNAALSTVASSKLVLLESILIGTLAGDVDILILEHDGTTQLWKEEVDASSFGLPKTIKYGKRGALINEGFSIQLLAAGTTDNTTDAGIYVHYREIYP